MPRNSPWPGDMLEQGVAGATVPVDRAVADAARRKVVRDCPDDFELILDALGLA